MHEAAAANIWQLRKEELRRAGQRRDTHGKTRHVVHEPVAKINGGVGVVLGTMRKFDRTRAHSRPSSQPSPPQYLHSKAVGAQTSAPLGVRSPDSPQKDTFDIENLGNVPTPSGIFFFYPSLEPSQECFFGIFFFYPSLKVRTVRNSAEGFMKL